MADPLSLDAAQAYEWRFLAAQVMRARRNSIASSTNPMLQAAVDREPASPAARAYLLWIADNLGIDRQFEEADDAYQALALSTAPPLIADYDFTDGPTHHRAQVALLAGNMRVAIDSWRALAATRPGDAEPLLLAGAAAEQMGDPDLAAELYGARMAGARARHGEDAAQLSHRAHARLKQPASAFSADPRTLADTLLDALERKDLARLRALASATHFAIGPAGGHAAFESDEMLEHLLRELGTSTITALRTLGGRGDTLHLQTRGWRGRWYRGDLLFMLTRSARGWQWTGLGLTLGSELWAEHADAHAPRKMTNAPLPFELQAPWPQGFCFRAGGLWAADFLAQGATILAAGPLAGYFLALGYSAASACGFGLRGLYFNDDPTHNEESAFAVDFVRCRRFVPFMNSSGGTPVLAVRDGIVQSVHGFGTTGGDTLNRIQIAHGDPADPADETRFTSRYLHMEGPMIDAPSELMPIIAGNRIGRMDNTGGNSAIDHLHFSMHDRRINFPGFGPGASVRPTPMAGITLEDGDSGRCVCSKTIEREGLAPMIEITEYAGQNWLITPAATAVGQAPPSKIEQQLYLLVLSGVAVVEFRGNSESNWRRETISLRPDLQAPLLHAANRHGLPKPPGTAGSDFFGNFRVEQWAPFAALSSVFNSGESNNSGFAVNVWRPNPFAVARDFFTGNPVDNLFAGIQVDIAARDTDAYVKRVSYKITLLGRIVFVPNIVF